MPEPSEYIGIFLTFFTYFCIIAFPAAIIIYIYDRWKNWCDPTHAIKTSKKEKSKLGQSIRATAGVLMIVLGGILFVWPVYRLIILNDSPYEMTVPGILLLINELDNYYFLPLTLIGIGCFYLRNRKRNIGYTKRNAGSL